MLTLDGRTAIVTGGASGIGAAVCTALQKEGVRVASLDLTDRWGADLGTSATSPTKRRSRTRSRPRRRTWATSTTRSSTRASRAWARY